MVKTTVVIHDNIYIYVSFFFFFLKKMFSISVELIVWDVIMFEMEMLERLGNNQQKKVSKEWPRIQVKLMKKCVEIM